MQVPNQKAYDKIAAAIRAHDGLTVQGASPTRLTPYPNPNVYVAPETIKAIGLRSVARLFLEGKTAIARVGLGLRPAARIVSGHVQAAIFFAGLARKVANSPSPALLTPTAAPPSEGHVCRDCDGDPVDSNGEICKGCEGECWIVDDVEVTLELPGGVTIPLEGYETDKPFESNPEIEL